MSRNQLFFGIFIPSRLKMMFLLMSAQILLTTLRTSRTQQLTAVNHSSYALHLYLKLRSTDAPQDVATSSSLVRKRICDDIVLSGLLSVIHMSDVPVEDVYTYRTEPKYFEVFDQLYSFSESENAYVYTNSYRRREFNVAGVHRFDEHVFACPVLHFSDTNHILLYHVSKEYNINLLSAAHRPYRPGRFIFGRDFQNRKAEYDRALLAEEPAIAYEEKGFDVELYYLKIRKRVKLAETDEMDPLCKLLTKDSRDPVNQHYRFCLAVSRSSYFKSQFLYPMRMPHLCDVREVSFRRPEAAEGITEKLSGYFERMTLCRSQHIHPDEDETHLYISRAYMSDQIFIYRLDPTNNQVYLENLSINVSIVDELNSFDFMES